MDPHKAMWTSKNKCPHQVTKTCTHKTKHLIFIWGNLSFSYNCAHVAAFLISRDLWDFGFTQNSFSLLLSVFYFKLALTFGFPLFHINQHSNFFYSCPSKKILFPTFFFSFHSNTSHRLESRKDPSDQHLLTNGSECLHWLEGTVIVPVK